MGTKVKEIPQASLAARPCDVEKGGCCSSHRRKDRIYEDQVWRFVKDTGKYPFCDGSEADKAYHERYDAK